MASSGIKAKEKDKYSPLPWNDYFSKKLEVDVNNDKFNVYISGNEGPFLVLLHGGGYSGLTWALFSKKIVEMANCHIFAIDFRGHGETKTENENDLSAEILAQDVKKVIYKYFNNNPPTLILVGHSMGGAIAIHTLAKDYLPTCQALVVIDVVEGSAMDALSGMQSFLRSRPSSFSSLEQAIEWALNSCQLQNLESARVSMPGQLKLADPSSTMPPPNAASFGRCVARTVIEEEDEEEYDDGSSRTELQTEESRNDAANNTTSNPNQPYVWRIDLTKTEKYWAGWFKDLTKMFVSSKVPKLLILAGTDRLDKEMTIAQMQGKFQMQVLPKAGHAIHEDDPQQVAKAVFNFLVRYKLIEPIVST